MRLKDLEWQEGNPSRWDGYNVTEPMIVQYEDGCVQIVGNVNMEGGTCSCCKDRPYSFEGIKRWAKLEIE